MAEKHDLPVLTDDLKRDATVLLEEEELIKCVVLVKNTLDCGLADAYALVKVLNRTIAEARVAEMYARLKS
jgi:hypothetical protein